MAMWGVHLPPAKGLVPSGAGGDPTVSIPLDREGAATPSIFSARPLRWAAIAFSAWLATVPGAASALMLEEIVSQVWTRFEAECGLALGDPQEYLRMIETDYRKHIVQTTPDGGFYVVWAEQQTGQFETFENSYATQGTNGLGSVECHVSFGSYTAGGESWRPEAMDAAFRAEAVRGGVTSLAGGVMKNHDMSPDQMLDGVPDFDSYDYVMTGRSVRTI